MLPLLPTINTTASSLITTAHVRRLAHAVEATLYMVFLQYIAGKAHLGFVPGLACIMKMHFDFDAPTWLTTALVETAHHPGSRGVADIVSVTMPLLSKTLQLLFPPERALLKMTHRYIN